MNYDQLTATQLRLFNLISHVHSWQHLAQLPDQIAEALIHLAFATRGCGYPAIEGRQKLGRLASMSHSEIIQAWDKLNDTHSSSRITAKKIKFYVEDVYSDNGVQYIQEAYEFPNGLIMSLLPPNFTYFYPDRIRLRAERVIETEDTITFTPHKLHQALTNSISTFGQDHITEKLAFLVNQLINDYFAAKSRPTTPKTGSLQS
jgi:hypothetical protein